jgi:hypothetical protein
MDSMENWLDAIRGEPTTEDTPAAKKKTHTLDLFKDVLPALDRGDKGYYSRLTEEERKGVSPWILMRWMTSVQNDSDQPSALIAVNTLVNHNFSHLGAKVSMGRQGHPELQWKLLAMCGSGSVRRKFIKPARGQTKNRLEQAVSEFFPGLNTQELELLLRMNTKQELCNFFKDNGYDDKTIEEIIH